MATTPTSTTASGAPARGFTLLELLVVLAIVAVIAAISVPRIGLPSALGAPGEAARRIAAGLAEARAAAIREDREVAFVLDVEARTYRVGARPPRALPARLRLALHTAEDELVDAARGAIRFYPDGSASGGRITLADGEDADAPAHTVRVRWLTGRVRIEP